MEHQNETVAHKPLTIRFVGHESQAHKAQVSDKVREFVDLFSPVEAEIGEILVFTDNRTKAHYCECHVKASLFIAHSTTDVSLDPDEQGEYRANREIVENHPAYERMKADALKLRSFSNIVAEFNPEQNPEKPLGVIGGQHRTDAIREALAAGKADEFHELKVYFGLDQDQRLDVQVISNTVIAVSGDLYDRMLETVKGPELRDWCHETGLLDAGKDFGDKAQRGGDLTVRLARTFIMNYYEGKKSAGLAFDSANTSPVLPAVGTENPIWVELRKRQPSIWEDAKLRKAGEEFAKLISSQRNAFEGKKGNADYKEKALNIAIVSAWAYTAGLLSDNPIRLDRHYGLSQKTGRDPLNSSALAKGSHKTDPENYRGLGTRTDAKERGRLVELFFLQADKGDGISPALVQVAIAKYHAKQGQLEVLKLQKALVDK
jgi:hypothetical protein